MEAALRANYVRRSLVLVRWALLLGIVQYAGYGLLDRWMVPVATGPVRTVCVAVCVIIALGFVVNFAGLSRDLVRELHDELAAV